MNTVEAVWPSWMTCHRGSSTIRGRLLIGGNAGARCTSDPLHVAPMHRFQRAAIAPSMCSRWLVILPNNFDLPKYRCSACADTQRDVGEMLPVSAQLHVQAVFSLIVQWHRPLPHIILASAYASRREGSQSRLRARACVRFTRATANRRLHNLGARPQTSAFDFPRARGDTGRCCASLLEYSCSTCVVSLRNAEAVHILGWLSTGGNAGWC